MPEATKHTLKVKLLEAMKAKKARLQFVYNKQISQINGGYLTDCAANFGYTYAAP